MATAALTGTVTAYPTNREVAIVAGGSTIILTLTGDTWVASGATFDAQRQNIINGLTSSGSETNGWNNQVKAVIGVGTVVRTSNTVVTITLTACAAYNITALETITVTIPSTALTGAVAIVASPTFYILQNPATFYVSCYGADTNTGLGADPTQTQKPWLTMAKALGAAGISSGDTCYLGPGCVFRESVTVNMTSAVAETIIAGDPSNAQGFCDGSGTRLKGAMPIWSSWTTNDRTVTAASSPLLLNGRDFLTFQDFALITGINTLIDATTTTSTNITLQRLLLWAQGSGIMISVTSAADISVTWNIKNCLFGDANQGVCIQFTPATSTTADFNLASLIENCLFYRQGNNNPVRLSPSGANSFKPGGVTVRNCHSYNNATFINVTNANASTTIPSSVVNNLFVEGGTNATLIATSAGQITENYNLGNSSSPRTNVTAGANSSLTASGQFALWHNMITSALIGAKRPSIVGFAGSVHLGWASDGNHPSTDINGLPRPCGTMTFGDSGTATSGTTSTIVQSTKAWGTNQWQGWTVKITSGTGSGQVKQINSNTATALTVSGLWQTTPDNTSVYTIYQGVPASSGKLTTGGTTTQTDANAAWGVNQWTGYVLEIRAGTGSGQSTTVTSNTATVITCPALTATDNTSQYWLYRKTSENTVNVAAGCFEAGNTWYTQTTTVRSGTNALACMGPAVQDFDLPVNAVATTVKVWMRYDSNYSGTLPQMKVLFGDECGVSDATATMVGAASTWEQLSLTFTPARTGIVTIRLQSNSTVPISFAFADDFTQTPVPNLGNLGTYTRRGDQVAELLGVGAPGFFIQ